MRRISAALATLLSVAVLAGLAPPATAEPVTYVAPVSGRVTDPFRPPKDPYGAGNRGLEYETAPGSVARAAAGGRVTFAGQVGGYLHVVVQHDDGVRTSYSFLRSVNVRTGQQIDQGHTVGTTGDSFHFGARIGDAYVDPAVLLAYGPAQIHLIPDSEFREEGAGNDRQALAAAITDHAGSITRGAWAWLTNPVKDAGRFTAQHFVTVLDEVVNMGQAAGPYASVAAALADVLEQFVEPCTPEATTAPPVRERRIAVFVAGLGSKSSSRLSKDFHAEELGYAPGDIVDFSYRGGRHPRPYKPKDTVGDLRLRARDLRELLDEIGRQNPGVHIDLIAHSQGGLIAREALAELYDDDDRRLPPVDRLITLGTPHHGADVATALAWLNSTREGRAIRALAKNQHTNFDLTGPGPAQLAETSEFIRELNARPLRNGVTYTSIGASTDIIVPAVRTRLKGARNVLVDMGGPLGAHSALHDAPQARRELLLALNDMPAGCQRILATAGRAVAGAGIAEFEDLFGRYFTRNP